VGLIFVIICRAPRSRRSLIRGEVDICVGNGAREAALAEGTYDLTLPNGLILVVMNLL